MDCADESLVLVPETASELDDLERSRLHLASAGCPLELWEILLLTQSGAWDLRTRTANTPDGAVTTPAPALRALRDAEGPFVRDLRFLLERMAASAEVACAEIVIAALTASRHNRAAVHRWIADPARHRPEAQRGIASLSWRAGKLMEQLDCLRAAAWESSLREDSGPGREGSARGPVPALDPRLLSDLRRVHRGSFLLREHLYH